MSKMILRWQEADEARSQTIDFGSLVSKKAGVVCLGRDPHLCDVVFSDPRISRLQAEIKWHPVENSCYLQNLRQSNPIFVGEQQIVSNCRLYDGAILVMGTTQIQIVVVQESVSAVISIPESEVAVPAKSNYPSLEVSDSSSLRYSQLIPLSLLGKDPQRASYLLPGILTVILVVLLFASIGNSLLFNTLLATYLGGGGFWIIYRCCGKPKPWWVVMIPMILTPLLLLTPIWSWIAFVFRGILPGRLPTEEADLISTFVAFFFGAGLAEELLKALSVFGLAVWGQSLNPKQQDQVGVTEPLDGIILGAASGLGFTLLETLGQYVPNITAMVESQLGAGVGELLGLQLLIPRILASGFGHMAYSGYFGYYIGLSYLKPSKRWLFLTVGWLVSSVVHAFWNTSSSLGWIAQGLAGIVAYYLLAGCILKARQLSEKYAHRLSLPH